LDDAAVSLRASAESPVRVRRVLDHQDDPDRFVQDEAVHGKSVVQARVDWAALDPAAAVPGPEADPDGSAEFAPIIRDSAARQAGRQAVPPSTVASVRLAAAGRPDEGQPVAARAPPAVLARRVAGVARQEAAARQVSATDVGLQAGTAIVVRRAGLLNRAEAAAAEAAPLDRAWG